MTTKAKTILLFLPSIVFTILVSCRNESDLLVEANPNQIIEANSKVADLMSKVSANDGSIDNIIDNSTCFTVKLPLTVIANGSEQIINSEEDFQIIEDIFSGSSDDTDTLEIIYPITIIFSDYTEQVITSNSELESVTTTCTADDTNIECVDFKYPFEISYFDSENEIAQILTMNNDRELFGFLEDLKEGDVANISFPITIVFTNDTEITIDGTDELEEVIEDSLEDCDEDDSTIDDFSTAITQGTWEVQKYKDNESNETQNYRDFVFTFLADGSISIEDSSTGEVFDGTWSVVTRADGGLNAILDFGSTPPLDKLGNNWNVKKVQDTRIMLDERTGPGVSKDELFFQQIR